MYLRLTELNISEKKEGKEMKKSFTTSQVKMITRTIIDKRFEM